LGGGGSTMRRKPFRGDAKNKEGFNSFVEGGGLCSEIFRESDYSTLWPWFVTTEGGCETTILGGGGKIGKVVLGSKRAGESSKVYA